MPATDSESIDKAASVWLDATDYLVSLAGSAESDITPSPQWSEWMQFLSQLNSIHTLIPQWMINSFHSDMRSAIAPAFWSHFDHTKANLADATQLQLSLWVCRQTHAALTYLDRKLLGYSFVFAFLRQQFTGQAKSLVDADPLVHVPAILLNEPLAGFDAILQRLYQSSFQAHRLLSKRGVRGGRQQSDGGLNDTVMEDDQENDGDDGEDEDEDEDDEQNMDLLSSRGSDNEQANSDDRPPSSASEAEKSAGAREILVLFKTIPGILAQWRLAPRLARPFIVQIATAQVKQQLNRYSDSFDSSRLPAMLDWLERVIFPWIALAFGDSSELPQLKDRLGAYAHEAYGAMRIRELFDIIVEFPDSSPALEDLKICLEKVDQSKFLVQSLRASFEKRLLHSGANTADILTQYISAIKSLRVLDKTGVTLELACAPVRQYLFDRDDTIRCIVNSLIYDTSSELHGELANADGNAEDDLSDTEDATDTWLPAPIETDPKQTARFRRSSDIISLLLSIYGSKERFVDEYRSMLADRLLAALDYDTDKEVRNLELLKLRFGESNMLFCEIMLRDIAESKRINSNIHKSVAEAKKVEDFPLNVHILSRLYWPNLKDETFQPPARVLEFIESYQSGFETLKAARFLQWKHSIGSVDVDLELEDRTLSFSVAPPLASLAMLFEQKDTWTLSELAEETKASPATVRKRLAFWIAEKVVQEVAGDTFSVVERLDQLMSQRAAHGTQADGDQDDLSGDEDVDDAGGEDKEAGGDELDTQQCWMFVSMMLTNLEVLPFERMQMMMGMYAPAMNLPEKSFKRFLDQMIAEGKLLYTGGEYRLAK